MLDQAYKETILSMSMDDRIELLALISKSFANDSPGISDAHKKLLDDRLAEHHRTQ